MKGIEPSSSAWKACDKANEINGCFNFLGVKNGLFWTESLMAFWTESLNLNRHLTSLAPSTKVHFPSAVTENLTAIPVEHPPVSAPSEVL
jgi:hypothetical protein